MLGGVEGGGESADRAGGDAGIRMPRITPGSGSHARGRRGAGVGPPRRALDDGGVPPPRAADHPRDPDPTPAAALRWSQA